MTVIIIYLNTYYVLNCYLILLNYRKYILAKYLILVHSQINSLNLFKNKNEI